MSIRLSLGLENSLLGEFGLSAMMNYGVIEIYSGEQPDGAENSPTGTLLGRITQNGVPFQVGTVIGGCQLELLGTGGLGFVPGWRLKGVTTGIAGWWRWKWNQPDDDSDSLYYPRMDGLVGESLVLRSNSITSASDILISNFFVSFTTCGT
jgi:hypothetical protein